jgi:murein DD-endopeptidase MepM/ murein hydrolase activator NlpD
MIKFDVQDTIRQPAKFDFWSDIAPMVQAQAQQRAGQLSQQVESGGDFLSPLAGNFKVTQGFGNVNDLYKGLTAGSKHMGLDIGAPAGTSVRAPVSGKLVFGEDPRGFGNYAQVVAPDGTVYQFSHLSALNRIGDQIKAGQEIGRTGGVPGTKGAGNTTGAHLDLSVKRGGKFVDPMSIEALQRLFNNGYYNG